MHQHFSELSSINFQDDDIKKSHDKLVDSTEKKKCGYNFDQLS